MHQQTNCGKIVKIIPLPILLMLYKDKKNIKFKKNNFKNYVKFWKTKKRLLRKILEKKKRFFWFRFTYYAKIVEIVSLPILFMLYKNQKT